MLTRLRWRRGTQRLQRRVGEWRRRAGAVVADGGFRSLAYGGRLVPWARPERHGIECIRNVPYAETNRREHRLDIYRPRDLKENAPALLYIHGGGFRMLSKDSHWVMALAFARRGYVVFNINYRLAPRHPFPAAAEDTCEAYAWVTRHAHEYGGDVERLIVAGESAGANLTLMTAVAACFPRTESFAQKIWETCVVPKAVVPACGMLQVSDCQRFRRAGRRYPWWLNDRLLEVGEAYLAPYQTADGHIPPQRACALADPLLILEEGLPPVRPFPACFAPVGTADPLLDDTRRLERSLERLGVPCEARYYPGGVHAFHAFIWRRLARRCWRDIFTFLEGTVASDKPHP